MIRTRVMMLNSIKEFYMSEYTATVEPDIKYTTVTLYYGEDILTKQPEVYPTSNVTSTSFNSTSGKLTISYSENTSTSNNKSIVCNVVYANQTLTISITLKKDYLISSNTDTKYDTLVWDSSSSRSVIGKAKPVSGSTVLRPYVSMQWYYSVLKTTTIKYKSGNSSSTTSTIREYSNFLSDYLPLQSGTYTVTGTKSFYSYAPTLHWEALATITEMPLSDGRTSWDGTVNYTKKTN